MGAYSRAVRAGPFVFVSGQIPRDPATGRLIGDDVRGQTAQVLKNIRLVLGEAGLTLDDVVSVTVYLAEIGDWDAFNAEFRATFNPPFPSRPPCGWYANRGRISSRGAKVTQPSGASVDGN